MQYDLHLYLRYSDVMRKSFHNESISYLRKTNNEYVEVLESQLSALLSGTPGQVRRLIPDPENGLFSRFMYYHLPMKPDWNDVFADSLDVSLDDTYADLCVLWTRGTRGGTWNTERCRFLIKSKSIYKNSSERSTSHLWWRC